MSFIKSAFNITANYIKDYSETAALRGEVPFERWYYHYNLESATKELGHLSSRVWALAYAVESAVKAIIVTFSILAYAYMENDSEIKRSREALESQGSSLFYSACAILTPEIARDAFKEANTHAKIARRATTLLLNYTLYRGNITLKMLINTH